MISNNRNIRHDILQQRMKFPFQSVLEAESHRSKKCDTLWETVPKDGNQNFTKQAEMKSQTIFVKIKLVIFWFFGLCNTPQFQKPILKPDLTPRKLRIEK